MNNFSERMSPGGLDNTHLSHVTSTNPNEMKFDDVERLESSNTFIEETIILASNVTELVENHYALVNSQS
jgi:hypothetical protein